MMQLKRLTEKSGKCVITSIHQPSSQIFHMFSQLLLLAEGQVAYFGNASKILTFFEEVGLPCSPCYNPADFILEAVKKDKETLDKILQYAEEKRKSEDWPEKLRRESENLSTTSSSFGINSIMINGGGDLTSICVVNVPDGSEMRQSLPPHWETSFGLQFRMLCWRAFKQSRSHILSKYSIGTSVVVSILVGLLWFQIPRTYDTIRDRMGMLFFSVLFNGFISHQTAAFSFSPERPVVMKERAAGWYRVSAFYFAKLTSEMPLIFLLPSVFFTPTYWMAGLKGTAEFFASWAILLLTCFVAKCFGFIIGTACLNDRLLASVSISFLLSSALAGGFYTQTVPSWLTWVRYLSFVKHSLSALSRLEFSDIPPIPCANVTEQFLHWCADNGTEHVTGEMMLADVGMGLPTYSYVVTLSILLILLYFIGYWTTRIFTRPR